MPAHSQQPKAAVKSEEKQGATATATSGDKSAVKGSATELKQEAKGVAVDALANVAKVGVAAAKEGAGDLAEELAKAALQKAVDKPVDKAAQTVGSMLSFFNKDKCKASDSLKVCATEKIMSVCSVRDCASKLIDETAEPEAILSNIPVHKNQADSDIASELIIGSWPCAWQQPCPFAMHS